MRHGRAVFAPHKGSRQHSCIAHYASRMDTHEKEEFDLQGRIGCFTLSDLLQTLSFTQKTGTLTLIQGWNTRTICYEQGRITYIAAATRLPSVVDLLIQAGKLKPSQLERVLGPKWKDTCRLGQADLPSPVTEPIAQRANGASSSNGHHKARTDPRLTTSSLLGGKERSTDPYLSDFDGLEAFAPPDRGDIPSSYEGPDPTQILLKYKLVTLEELSWCEEQLLESTIYTLFLWRNCRFTFQGDVMVKSDGINVTVSAEKLIIEGTRRVDEWIGIAPVIPSVLMAFRRLPRPATGPLSDEAREVLTMVDGVSDVASIARKRQRTQFDTAKLLYGLTRLRLIQPVPPDKPRVIELFRYTVEAIYIKLVMYGYSRKAQEFEYELNRFARENKLKVRMHVGKIRITDGDLPVDSITLLDLYKLFIAIENNRFTKLFPSEIRKGLTEALYQHMTNEDRALMRMYEFHAMEGLLNIPPPTEVKA
jgi:hypothetical protein